MNFQAKIDSFVAAHRTKLIIAGAITMLYLLSSTRGAMLGAAPLIIVGFIAAAFYGGMRYADSPRSFSMPSFGRNQESAAPVAAGSYDFDAPVRTTDS